MKIKWNDDIPYQFLMKFGIEHGHLLQNATDAIRNLKFKEISIDDFELRKHPYTIFLHRLRHHATRIKNTESFGTLFCRKRPNGKWFIKDGNHRFYVLVSHGVTKFRIAYADGNPV